MKTHIIENGVITNTIMATVQEAALAYPNATFLNADKGGALGDEVKNGAVVIPEVSLEQLKEIALSEIEAIKISRAFSGVPFLIDGTSYLFGKHQTDITKIHGVASDIRIGAIEYSVYTGGYWKAKDGTRVVMTEPQFLEMSNTITIFLLKNEQAAHDAKDAIDGVTETDAKDKLSIIVENYRSMKLRLTQ